MASYNNESTTEQRLTDLAIISMERDISAQLSSDLVVNEFSAKENNCHDSVDSAHRLNPYNL